MAKGVASNIAAALRAIAVRYTAIQNINTAMGTTTPSRAWPAAGFQTRRPRPENGPLAR